MKTLNVPAMQRILPNDAVVFIVLIFQSLEKRLQDGSDSCAVSAIFSCIYCFINKYLFSCDKGLVGLTTGLKINNHYINDQ